MNMNKFFILISLSIVFGTLIIPTNIAKLDIIEKQRIEHKQKQDYVDNAMRNVGLCRWWLLVYDLPDRAYKDIKQVPDLKFREDMDRRCPEARINFVGPKNKDYYEDRKRWRKEFGQYKEWRQL